MSDQNPEPLHEVAEWGTRVDEGVHDTRLSINTTPPTRWEPEITKVLEPDLGRSAYDAGHVVSTSPPTRWEPAASVDPAPTSDSGSAPAPPSTDDQ